MTMISRMKNSTFLFLCVRLSLWFTHQFNHHHDIPRIHHNIIYLKKITKSLFRPSFRHLFTKASDLHLNEFCTLNFTSLLHQKWDHISTCFNHILIKIFSRMSCYKRRKLCLFQCVQFIVKIIEIIKQLTSILYTLAYCYNRHSA